MLEILEVCDKATNYIFDYLKYLDINFIVQKVIVSCINAVKIVYCDKGISIKLCNNDDDYHDKVLCVLSGFCYSKIANTVHDSCYVWCSVQ